jgi:membrane fusion protein (multidrug efflux system)
MADKSAGHNLWLRARLGLAGTLARKWRPLASAHSLLRLGITFAFAALLTAAPTHAQNQAVPAAVPVGIVTAEKQPVARAAEFVGRIEAPGRVDVRARVSGYLDAVLFKEGDRVREGDALYRIDQAPFQAAVQQAQGALLRAQAEYTNATLQARRSEELVKTSAHRRPSGTGAWRRNRLRRARS